MPLDDESISREPDGSLNDEYCRWCYTDGKFIYTDLGQLIDFLTEHMANDRWPAAQARAFFEEQLPKLRYWNKESE